MKFNDFLTNITSANEVEVSNFLADMCKENKCSLVDFQQKNFRDILIRDFIALNEIIVSDSNVYFSSLYEGDVKVVVNVDSINNIDLAFSYTVKSDDYGYPSYNGSSYLINPDGKRRELGECRSCIDKVNIPEVVDMLKPYNGNIPFFVDLVSIFDYYNKDRDLTLNMIADICHNPLDNIMADRTNYIKTVGNMLDTLLKTFGNIDNILTIFSNFLSYAAFRVFNNGNGEIRLQILPKYAYAKGDESIDFYFKANGNEVAQSTIYAINSNYRTLKYTLLSFDNFDTIHKFFKGPKRFTTKFPDKVMVFDDAA
jgi:hypothetical protein